MPGSMANEIAMDKVAKLDVPPMMTMVRS